MNRLRVYISGPITSGNRNQNYAKAADAHEALMYLGFAPLNPMATMTLPFAWKTEAPHSLWIDCDLPWVEAADAVLRLPGYSVGADAELEHAKRHGVPIFYEINDLVDWSMCRREEKTTG